MPQAEAALVVAVVIPVAIGAGCLVLLIIALVIWWRASAAAERAWRESERSRVRSRGDVLNAIRESHHPSP